MYQVQRSNQTTVGRTSHLGIDSSDERRGRFSGHNIIHDANQPRIHKKSAVVKQINNSIIYDLSKDDTGIHCPVGLSKQPLASSLLIIKPAIWTTMVNCTTNLKSSASFSWSTRTHHVSKQSNFIHFYEGDRWLFTSDNKRGLEY